MAVDDLPAASRDETLFAPDGDKLEDKMAAGDGVLLYTDVPSPIPSCSI